MRHKKIQFIFFLFIIGTVANLKSQSIEEKLGNAYLFNHENYIYIYNLENERIFNIRKYDMDLKLMATYSKTLPKNVASSIKIDLFFVSRGDSTINAYFQLSKEKMLPSNYARKGTRVELDYNLKELISEETSSDSPLLPLTLHSEDEFGLNHYRPIEGDILGNNVKTKYSIPNIGHTTQLSKYKDGHSLLFGNYKEGADKKNYKGFFILNYEKDSIVTSMKKYPFFSFNSDPKKDTSFLIEFYTDMAKMN
ncbi:MAG TPA: hypothetical protein VNX68_18070, partial [Nitrosopumilaceae archaeon]|nr:hypothetical protein [Nitrosopumilaceae archaeon]